MTTTAQKKNLHLISGDNKIKTYSSQHVNWFPACVRASERVRFVDVARSLYRYTSLNKQNAVTSVRYVSQVFAMRRTSSSATKSQVLERNLVTSRNDIYVLEALVSVVLQQFEFIYSFVFFVCFIFCV